LDINEIIQQVNVAEQIEDNELEKIGRAVVDGYNVDEDSRADWLKSQEEALKLAVQVKEQKSFPWRQASNIKFPLLTIASLQFQARAYQTLIPDTAVVKGRVVGNDPDNAKADKAMRISQHMSYQLLEEIDNWEDDMDSLCLTLPICGTVFKKIYHNGQRPCVELILPQDLCINYYAKSLDSAPRVTHVLELSTNDVIEKIRSGQFLDKEEFYNQTQVAPEPNDLLEKQGFTPSGDAVLGEIPSVFLEQHTWWDLDDDGYKEPYVITVHKATGIVARIAPRFREDKVLLNDKGQILKIEPTSYFQHYIFVPNPVSGIYGIGFGLLLGPINEACNTLINQLVDSGTLNNMPSGFMGRGIRLMGGNYAFQPGEFKMVQSTGTDLKQGIFQFDFKPPSPVLFQLLGTLISSGQNVASVTDTMLGEQPGQNTPFSTTQEVLSQGLKVYSSIMKRIHRGLKKELKKLYQLNKYYLTGEQYFTVLDHNSNDPNQQTQISSTDYQGDDTDVVPSSDPTLVSDVQKLQQSRVIGSLLQMGLVNPQESARRILEAERIPDMAALLELPPPQPNFDQQIEMQKLEMEKAKQERDSQVEQFRVAAEAAKDEAEAMLKQTQAAQLAAQGQMEQVKMQFEMMKHEMQMQMQQLKNQGEIMKIEATQAKMELTKQQAATKKYDPASKSFKG